MTIEPSPSPGGDALRRVTLTVAGLAALAAVFVFAVPRRAEIAASMRPVAAAPALELEVPEIDPTDPAAAETAQAEETAATARDVTPDGLTGAEGSGSTLKRLPPRPAPETPPETETKTSTEAAPVIEDVPPEPVKPKPMRVLARPIALDTATFLVGKAKVSLTGVQAVPSTEECPAAAGGTWPCGMQARTALRGWLRARSIRCDVPKDFVTSTSETQTECALGTKDIAAWLVENGWAEAAPGSRYVAAERKARADKLGIWGGGGG